MFGILVGILILDSFVLATAVLLQAGSGGGLASLGGGAGTETVMGGRQATTLLTKVTWWTAGIFLFLSLVLTFMSQSAAQPRSVLEGQGGAPAPVQQSPLPIETQPAAPPPAAPATPAKPNRRPQAPARLRPPRGRRCGPRNRSTPVRAGVRRSRLHHKSERLPGGLHRSLLPRPDSRDDGAYDRQLRHQSGRRRVGPAARGGRRRTRAVGHAVQLALDGPAARMARERQSAAHFRRRHATAHSTHPLERCDARRARGGRGAQRNDQERPCGLAVDERTRPGERRDDSDRVYRRADRRETSRRRIRLRDEAQHPAAVRTAGMSCDCGARRDERGAGSGAEAEWRFSVERSGRPCGGRLRDPNDPGALGRVGADLWDLPWAPAARTRVGRRDGQAAIWASRREPSCARSRDRTSTYHLTEPRLRGARRDGRRPRRERARDHPSEPQ